MASTSLRIGYLLAIEMGLAGCQNLCRYGFGCSDLFCSLLVRYCSAARQLGNARHWGNRISLGLSPTLPIRM
jgi:hypothetical protein